MSIETRVATTRAALIDAGRADLADYVLDADAIRRRHPGETEPPVQWIAPIVRADGMQIRRAAALASLAEGHDAPEVICERCAYAPDGASCGRVTRRDLLAHRSCHLHEVPS